MKKLLTILLLVPTLGVPTLGWGAFDFNRSVPQYATGATTIVTDEPITMCVGFISDDATVQQFLFDLRDADNDALTSAHAIIYDGTKAGDPVSCLSVNDSTFVVLDSGASGCGAGVTCRACCVFTAHNSRTAYVQPDGGSLVTASNATSIVTGAFTRSTLGARFDATNAVDGRLWDLAIWSAALTQAEIAGFFKGYAPDCIRRGSLEQSYSLIRTFNDSFGGVNLSESGSPAVANHPRVINCQ